MTATENKVKEKEEQIKEQTKQEAPPKTESQEQKSKKRTTKAKKTTGASKTKKLQEEIEKLQKEKAELKENHLRLAAEFDNYKKLMNKEIENRIRKTKEDLVLDVLLVLDDLERTLEVSSESEDSNSIVNGVEMIKDNMKKVLEKYGLEEIHAVGKEFDVDLHDALMITDDENSPSNIVVQEHQKGYKLNDRVIRPSKVSVNK